MLELIDNPLFDILLDVFLGLIVLLVITELVTFRNDNIEQQDNRDWNIIVDNDEKDIDNPD